MSTLSPAVVEALEAETRAASESAVNAFNHAARLAERLSTGDASVSPDELEAAQAEAERSRIRAVHVVVFAGQVTKRLRQTGEVHA